MRKPYIIEKGCHYSNFVFPGILINPTGIKFTAMFNNDCIYDISDNIDILDINKLYGFSRGYHVYNSARFGWRCIDNKKIEIFSLTQYRNLDKRIQYYYHKIGETYPFVDNHYEIKLVTVNGESYYEYYFDNVSKSVSASFTKEQDFPIGYTLHPYFGGNLVAPKEMVIFIKEEK